MKYSKNLGLNLPERNTDNVAIEVLNENFEKLDGAFENLFVMGTYTGDGAENRNIILKKSVSALLLFPQGGHLGSNNGNISNGGLALEGHPCQETRTSVGEKYYYEIFSVSEDVLTVHNKSYGDNTVTDARTNRDGELYYYIGWVK